MQGAGTSGVLAVLVRRRHAVAAAVAVVFGTLAVWPSWSNQGVDWTLLRAGGTTLLSPHGLHTYAHLPGLQAGPLALVLIGVLARVFGAAAPLVGHVLLYLELPLLLRLVEGSLPVPESPAARRSRELRLLLAGVGVAPVWASLAGATAHLDDGLALLAAVATGYYVVKNRPIVAAVAAGCAVAAKPWAIGALLLLVGLRHHRIRAAAVAVCVPVVSWLPELLDPRNLTTAAHYPFPVTAEAPLRVLGLLPETTPSWQRPVELLAILLAATVAAFRGRWADAFAASMVARLLFEITTLTYYDVDSLVAVVAADMATRRVPWRSGVIWLAVEAADLMPQGPAGIARLAALVIVLTSYLVPGAQRRKASESQAQMRAGHALLAS